MSSRDDLAEALPQGWLSVDDCRRIADALLPVVERIAREAAAEAVERAGETVWAKWAGNPDARAFRDALREIAAYYRAEALP